MNREIERVDGILSPDQAIELDQIQEIAANDALNFLDVRTAEDPYPLIAMATGIGKGRIIHKIIERSVRRNPKAKILVVAGTKLTLVDQTHSALQGYVKQATEIGSHEWTAAENDDEVTEETEDVSEENFTPSYLYSTVDYKKRLKSESNVHVATIQTVQSETDKGNIESNDYDLVIVDEAHNIGTHKRVSAIKQFNNVVGFTATPYRHSGSLRNPEQYGFTIINSLTLPEAQEKEFLPPLIETPISTSHLIEEIPTNIDGEIDYIKLERLLKNSEDLRPFIADKVREYITTERGEPKKTVIAVNFVWEAEELAELLKERGISVGVAVNNQAAKEIHSDEIPALDSIDRYKLPKDDPNGIQVLISPYVASEGFDAPQTEVLVWASPTDSSVRYTQFTGRLARRAPGKTYGHVIDFLYQTAQYNWSYNFGQWMKDTVVQLPNGMLFQGSRKQRQRLMQSTEFKRSEALYGKQRIPLDSLSELSDLILPEEGEFPITADSLKSTFWGKYGNVAMTARAVLEEIVSENPTLIKKRRNGTRAINVITDEAVFKQRMVEKGAVLRDQLQDVQSEEFLISNANLAATFIGSTQKLLPFANEVAEEIRRENPELVVSRRNKTYVNTVVRDRDVFVQKMLARGLQLNQEMQPIQEGEMAIGHDSLVSSFIGQYKGLKQLADEALKELREEHPNIIVQRRSGTRVVTVVTDPQIFIQRMNTLGAILRLEPKNPQNSFIISNASFRGVFSGSINRVRQIADEVLKELRNENPNLILRQSNGSNVSTVVTDGELFKRRMVEKGVKLVTADLPSVEENEFSVIPGRLIQMFVGGEDRLSAIAQEVIDENPELFMQRRLRNRAVPVARDLETFQRKMSEKGIRLKTNLPTLKDDEFTLTQSALSQIFTGGSRRLNPILQSVVEEIQRDNPNLIQQRRSGTQVVVVVLEPEIFIQKMLEKGANLKGTT